MKNFYLDPNTNDMTLESFNLRFTDGDREYYAQKIEGVIKTVLGEYFLDRDKGIPWYGKRGRLLSKNPDLDLIRATIISEINGIDGMSAVEKYDAEFDRGTRVYVASIRAITDSGAVIDREITL
jgi:hypothetical protein